MAKTKIEPKEKRIMRDGIYRVLKYGKYATKGGTIVRGWWWEHPKWFKEILNDIINNFSLSKQHG